MSLRLTVYRALERFGVHLTPTGARRKGYYSPLPNIQELESTIEEWAKPSLMPGINTTVEQQLKWVTETVSPFVSEIGPHQGYDEALRLGVGRDGYGPVEAHVHHAVIRRLAPRKIVEIGSGVSTVVATRAMGRDCHLTAIEPYPSDALRAFCAREDVALIPERAQRVAREATAALRANDVLFIDSSHAVKPGADAPFLVTEVIPRLAPGVIVHVHDIHFPYGYQPNALTTPFIWAETWLLWAFLINNPKTRVLASLSWLHHSRSDALRKLLPDYRPREMPHGLDNGHLANTHYPSSLWFAIQS
jgi:predicted O-methyltransferase YrrM